MLPRGFSHGRLRILPRTSRRSATPDRSGNFSLAEPHRSVAGSASPAPSWSRAGHARCDAPGECCKPRPESSERGGPHRTGKCPELPIRRETNGATHARPRPHLVPGRKSRTQCQMDANLSTTPQHSTRTGSEEQDPVPAHCSSFRLELGGRSHRVGRAGLSASRGCRPLRGGDDRPRTGSEEQDPVPAGHGMVHRARIAPGRVGRTGPRSPVVRTPDLHSGYAGSNPAEVTSVPVRPERLSLPPVSDPP